MDLEKNKEVTIQLLRLVKREGIENLINWLLSTDYFESPASARYHGDYTGGLCFHSLNVFQLLTERIKYHKLEVNLELPIIVGLLHDLCKINFYTLEVTPPTGSQLNFLNSLLRRNPNFPITQEELDKTLTSKQLISDVLDWLQGKKDKPDFTKPLYEIKDDLQLGHGEKSYYLITKYIDITEEEAACIRYHMGVYDRKYQTNENKYRNCYEKFMEKYKTLRLTQIADVESQLLE